MQTTTDTILSSVLQLILATVIPFLVYLAGRKKHASFAAYIGFTKPPSWAWFYTLLNAALFTAAGLGLAMVSPTVKEMMLSEKSVTGMLHRAGPGLSTVIILLLIAWVKTSLAEEIFFRGFIGKRLVSLCGFGYGNLLQAMICGVIHFLLFMALTDTTIYPLIFIFLFSSAAGWVTGYIKEKIADGSIIPGWIAHAAGNTCSYAFIAFCT